MLRWLTVILAAALAAAAAGAEQGGPPPAPEPGAKGGQEAASATAEPDISFVDEEGEGDETGQERPSSPFGGEGGVVRKDAVPGYIELSDGRKLPGKIYTTRAARLEIFNLARGVYEHVPAPALKRIEATVEWERMEKEWRFKEPGNPEKVYSGREYPARMLAWRLTLRNDHEISGHILGQPLYVTHEGKTQRWILHKRDKGPIGTSLQELVYIRRVEFGQEAHDRAVEELKAKAEAEAKAGPGKAAEGQKKKDQPLPRQGP